MARIFITGSADGLGKLAAEALIAEGHQVVLPCTQRKAWTRGFGASAPDDLQKGYETQVWLAVSGDRRVKASGRYFHHEREARYNPEADDVQLQEGFLSSCEAITQEFPSP